MVPKIPLRKEAHHRVRFLTQEEENAFVKAFIQNGYNTHAEVFLILLYTGFRLGECWRIECRDINLELGTITAWKTKNGHPRTIPIVDKIRPILERKIFEAGENGKLFPTADNRWFESAWNRIKRLLGLEKDVQLVPHALRHTCASRLAQRGVSMMVIKDHNALYTPLSQGSSRSSKNFFIIMRYVFFAIFVFQLAIRIFLKNNTCYST